MKVKNNKHIVRAPFLQKISLKNLKKIEETKWQYDNMFFAFEFVNQIKAQTVWSAYEIYLKWGECM